MSLYNNFETDPNLEKGGIILQYGYVERDGKQVPINIRIGRAGGANTKFSKTFERVTKPYARQIQLETLDPNISKKLFVQIYAEAVILDWENVQDKEGNFLEFTQENVIQVMTDLPVLFDDIQQQAQKVALFRHIVAEETAKN